MAHKRDEPHARLYHDLLDSDAYLTLPDSALRLLVDLRRTLTSTNNGMLLVTLAQLARRGWNSTSKLVRARDELMKRGILVRTKYCAPNVRHEASRYGFTDVPIPEQPKHGIVQRGEVLDLLEK